MTQRTILYETHVALGAKMTPFAGWDMPLQYSSIKQEVLAVRQNAGLFDVSHMGEFLVTGHQAIEFCDSIFTNHIKPLPLGKAAYGFLLNEEGGIIDDLIVYKISDQEILLCVNASNIEKDFSWIRSFKNSFDCQLKDLSSQLSLLALQGPTSMSVLKKVLSQQTSLMSQIESLPRYGVLRSGELVFARTGYTGEDGFEIFLPNSQANSFWKNLVQHGASPCGLAARDNLRLEAAYPLYGLDLSEELTPFDCGLSWAVKMEKPEFVGQAALKRRDIKFKMIKFTLDKVIPRSGYELFNEKGELIGRVTSGAMSATLNVGIGLGLVAKQSFTGSENLFVNIRGNHYPLKIQKSAFIKGSAQ